MATRTHHALRVLAPALLLLAGAVPLLAADKGISDSMLDEKRRLLAEAAAAPAAEIEAALAAERLPAALSRTRPVPFGAVGNPLAIGVDDATIPMELIDPTGVNPNVQVPVGIQVWGAAYDPVTDILYLSSGSTFHHWDVTAGTLTTIGPFTSSVDGVTLVMEGLAVANGTLLGSRVGNSATNPEGIYSIDPVTGVATLVEAFAITTGQTLSGLDADPVTGTLYGTNDATTNRGLVEIPLDGSGTVILITAYPAGETDIDGLAIGSDGRAYLVEDDGTGSNGQVHVWDFALAAYQTPIPTPWATNEVFSAGAWIEAGGNVARIRLTKTVGTTPGVCAPTDEITVVTGVEVYYCYTVENIGTLTLNFHDLVDDQLGVLFENEPITLAPGATHEIISSAVVITAPVVNNATWTARAVELVSQCSGAPILLPAGAPTTTSGPADPYPATVTFAGAPTAPGTVTVELRGISHTFPDDLDFLLEGPGGQTLVFMSDVGGGNDVVDIDLTIDDAAAAILPDSAQITAGSWQPSNVTSGDVFDAPAPAGPYGNAAPVGTDTLASMFGGLDPNGTWNLWIDDDTGGDFGELDEWCLNLRTDLGQATASDSATVNILDPQIAVTPASLSSTLEPGTTEDQPLTIQNTGGAPLDWAIDEALAGLARIPTAVLHDNGPLVTHPGGGFGGADASALQTALLMNTFGFGHQISANNRMADDFTVPGPTPWTIDTITFFAYQTGSTTTSTINDVRVQIWDGIPGEPGSNIVFGDLVTNRLVSSTWTNDYRVTDTTLTNSTRPIMASVVTIGTTLPAGTYWLDWFCGGTLASGPWAPPVTILGQTTTGNALQFIGTTSSWNPALDTGTSTQQDMPFVIEGTSSLCTTPSDLPWISVDPTSGSTAPGASDVVTVTFDAGALAPGVYDGLVCVNSNDPATPLVEVPVSLTVSDTMPFIDGFESGNTSAWSVTVP
jgi:subtilisin-like proprotein convertase family protein